MIYEFKAPIIIPNYKWDKTFYKTFDKVDHKIAKLKNPTYESCVAAYETENKKGEPLLVVYDSRSLDLKLFKQECIDRGYIDTERATKVRIQVQPEYSKELKEKIKNLEKSHI